jgi:hypothetical protein
MLNSCQTIGKVACFYRRNADKPKLALPNDDRMSSIPFVHGCAPKRIDSTRPHAADRTPQRAPVVRAQGRRRFGHDHRSRVCPQPADRCRCGIEDFRRAGSRNSTLPRSRKSLTLEPEVVLLGTGARITFPPAAVLAEFLKRGIGLETMDNAAAARTFNVLIGEGRRAVAVFLLPG